LRPIPDVPRTPTRHRDATGENARISPSTQNRKSPKPFSVLSIPFVRFFSHYQNPTFRFFLTMLMNYHEMTMSEPRDSPQRRKQFLFICTLMAAAFFHSVLQAGALASVVPVDGVFPGGTFVYKYTQRDYAATNSMVESVGKDVGLKPRDYADQLYTVYLDNPNDMGGRRQRFAAGYLVTDKAGKSVQKTLLQRNQEIRPPTPDELWDLPASKLWARLAYQTAELPSVNAAVVQFPFTNGFVSAMIQSWKVIPALRAYAKANGQRPGRHHNRTINHQVTVVSTCSIRDRMCTHYAPLYDGAKFLLGQPDSDTYQATFSSEPFVTRQGIIRAARKVFPGAHYFLPNPQ
jgi:hypothetical protein